MRVDEPDSYEGPQVIRKWTPRQLVQGALNRRGYALRSLEGSPRVYPDVAAALREQGEKRLLWSADEWRATFPFVAQGTDAEFQVGRYPASEPARTLLVHIDCVRTSDAYSYATSGWHPFIMSLREDIIAGDGRYAGSRLESYLTAYQPTIRREVLLEGQPEATGELLRREPRDAQLPWLRFVGQKGSAHEGGVASFGPTSPAVGQEHLQRLQGAYQSVRTHGYLPQAFPGGYIRGYLISMGDEYRFIVRGGHHRMAALSVVAKDSGVSGYLEVAFDPLLPPVVRIEDASRWPGVVSGAISEHWSRVLAQRYFTENGWEKRENIGAV